MGSGIEMKGVHKIVISQDWIIGGIINILRPARSSDYYHGILLNGTDCSDDGLRIFLDLSPGIVDLVDMVLI